MNISSLVDLSDAENFIDTKNIMKNFKYTTQSNAIEIKGNLFKKHQPIPKTPTVLN